MKPPKLPSGRRHQALPSVGMSGRARLISLVVMSLLFALGFLYIRYEWARSELPPEQAAYIQQADMPRIVRDPAARIDFKLLGEVADATRNQRLIREPEPYSHLLAEARKLTPGDLEALSIRRVNAAEILSNTDLQRGQAFEVKGTLESIEVVQGQLWQEVRGRLRAPDGQLYAFSVLKEPDAVVGDVVRLQGFFFKLLCPEVAPGEYEDNTIAIVGRSMVKSYLEMAPTADLSQAPFHQVRDFDLTDMVELQEDVLYFVLSYVRSLGKAGRETPLPETVEVTWADLRRQPDQYRGKLVRILARYAPGLEWPRKLGPEGENPLGVPQFQDGILALPRNRLIRWIGFDPIPAELLEDNKLIYLTGVFFKVFAWENNRGEILNGPLIVPIRFERFEMPRNEAIHQLGYGIAGTCLVLVLLFLVGVFRDGRRSMEFRREFLKRKRRRLESALGDGDEPSEPPDLTADA